MPRMVGMVESQVDGRATVSTIFIDTIGHTFTLLIFAVFQMVPPKVKTSPRIRIV